MAGLRNCLSFRLTVTNHCRVRTQLEIGLSVLGEVTSLTDGATRIELDLTIDYAVYDYDGDGPVRDGQWTKRERAVYFKPAGDQDAYLDRGKSTLSQHQLDAEYNIDSLDDEGLVRYNRTQLRRVGWKRSKQNGL